MSAAIQRFSSAGKEWNFSRQFFRFFFFNTSISSLTRRGNQQGRKEGELSPRTLFALSVSTIFSRLCRASQQRVSLKNFLFRARQGNGDHPNGQRDGRFAFRSELCAVERFDTGNCTWFPDNGSIIALGLCWNAWGTVWKIERNSFENIYWSYSANNLNFKHYTTRDKYNLIK